MNRAGERRKRKRRARKAPTKGASAAHRREPLAKSVSSSSALVEVTAATVETMDGTESIERATSLDGAALLPAVIDVAQLARLYEQTTTSPATRRLYLNRLTLFLAWCAAHGASAMPAHPEVLRRYLVSLAAEQKALSTIDVSLAAILMAHRALGHDVPMSDALRATLYLLRSTLGPRSTRSTPIALDVLRQIVSACGQDPLAPRDRALLLVTYFAGLGRLEAAGLDREGVQREERGYRLSLGTREHYRTEEPPGLALHAELGLCPVRALDGWLVVRAAWARGPALLPGCGPLFVALHRGRRQRLRVGARLAPGDVDRIVKRRAAAAGLDPAGLSAASLRAGFYAESARRNASLLDDASSAA